MAVDQSNLKKQLATRANNEVAELNKPKTIEELFQRFAPQFEKALPSHLSIDRMLRIATTAVNANPALKVCTPQSLLGAVMTSVQLGLEPNTPLGHAYLIPYKNKRKIDGKEVWLDEAQFQIGYKGIIELALRTGEYKAIYAHEVYANDVFEYQYGLHKDLKHIPADEPEGEPIKYYAVYHLQNGGYDFVVWSKKRIDAHAKKYSKAVQKGWTSPWETDYDGMAKKTVIKEVLKYAPKSIEFARQLSSDETIKIDASEDMTEVIDVTNYNAVYEEYEDEGTNSNGFEQGIQSSNKDETQAN